MLPFVDSIVRLFDETSKVAAPASWVTVTVFVGSPWEAIEIVAVRDEIVVFLFAIKLMVLLPVPDSGLGVSQFWSELSVHSTFEEMANEEELPAAAATFTCEGVTSMNLSSSVVKDHVSDQLLSPLLLFAFTCQK